MNKWYLVQCVLKDNQIFSGHYRAPNPKKALSWLFHDHKIKNENILQTSCREEEKEENSLKN